MTPEQNYKRNQAYHLLRVAADLLEDASMGEHAIRTDLLATDISNHAKKAREDIMQQRLP